MNEFESIIMNGHSTFIQLDVDVNNFPDYVQNIVCCK
jgi:hypothetical protein